MLDYLEIKYRRIEGADLKFKKEKFKKVFPNLAKELDLDENKIKINSLRTDIQTTEKAVSKRFVHYTPDVVDFIRRCSTEEQAEEIIVYMEQKGEINWEYAERLRKQLKSNGLKSFGCKKEEHYYLTRGEI